MSGRATQWIKRVLAVVGVAGALLSILFGFRSAYLYWVERELRNSEIDSWIGVSQMHFGRAEHYSSALTQRQIRAHALEQASSADADNTDLEVAALIAYAEMAAWELESVPWSFEAWKEAIPELVAEAWRLKRLLNDPEKEAEVLQLLARLEPWLGQGNVDTVQLLRDSLALRPDSPETKYQLANRLEGSEPAEAEALLSELVSSFPDNPCYSYRLASLLRTTGRTTGAMPLYAQAASRAQHAQTHPETIAIWNAEAVLLKELRAAIADAVPYSIPSPELADRLMNRTGSSGPPKVLEAIYWWERDRPFRSANAVLASDSEYRREPVPYLVARELDWYDIPSQALPPSLATLQGARPHQNYQARFAMIATEFHAYMATVEERMWLQALPGSDWIPGAEIQYWPGEGLFLRRVVPGYGLQQLGARPGDWLLQIDGQSIERPQQLQRLPLQGLPSETTLRRDGETITLPYEHSR